MPKQETKPKAASTKVAAKERKPLDQMSKEEMAEAGIYQDIIDDYFR